MSPLFLNLVLASNQPDRQTAPKNCMHNQKNPAREQGQGIVAVIDVKIHRGRHILHYPLHAAANVNLALDARLAHLVQGVHIRAGAQGFQRPAGDG